MKKEVRPAYEGEGGNREEDREEERKEGSFARRWKCLRFSGVVAGKTHSRGTILTVDY